MSESTLVHGRGGFQRTRWYLNRLRCMPPAEVLHRIARTLRTQAEALGLCRNVSPSARLTRSGVNIVKRPAIPDIAPYIEAADRIVDGRIDIFSMSDVSLGTPPEWNRDPKTGIEAPLAFGKRLDYRDTRLVGDIKYLWEPNRHLHLVTLAQAFAISGDTRYTDCLREHLDSWFRDCPFRFGPNWSSAMEPALRLINWSLAWQLLNGIDAELFAGHDGAAFRDRWLQSIHQHARFVHENFSRHSSANNHLIGEAAGLFIAATTWPFWADMRKWRQKAAGELEREAQLQNAPDGVNREQAVSYQQFVYDLFLLCRLAADAEGHPFSDAFSACMERMAGFLASVMDVAGNMPMIGDADDGYVVRLSQEADFCRYRSTLASAALLFGRPAFRQKAATLDDKTRWLFGKGAEQAWQRLAGGTDLLPPRRDFPTGGYYVLGCDLETPSEIRLVADAGPLGYREIAAHGHADALSFTLSVGGLEFLIDPGTYAYHADDRWRQYFRGTSAHNTLRVDRRDQSESGGNFMWLTKANAGCALWQVSDTRDVFEGWHDGYRRLPDPVMHQRRISLYKDTRRFEIEDRLVMSGTHEIELYFHCSEECRVEPQADGFGIYRGDRYLRLTLPRLPGAESRLYRGSERPVHGWVSRRYDQRMPSTTIVWGATVTGNTVLRSGLQC